VCLPVILKLLISVLLNTSHFHKSMIPGLGSPLSSKLPDVNRGKAQGGRVPMFLSEMRQNKSKRSPWLGQRTESVHY
jgi:hypothetical protein